MENGFSIIKLENYVENRVSCEKILSSLPDWFGPRENYEEYLDDLENRPVFGVRDGDTVVGIMALTQTSSATVDIHVIAVAPENHRHGIGRALVDYAENYARLKDMSFLTVKTLGPSHLNDFYPQTHAFYESMGFQPIEEYTDFWGDGYPMLLLCKSLHLAFMER